MATGGVTHVSVSSDGEPADGNSGFATVDISDDGRFVLFDSTATNLVTGDTNGESDLFVHDMQAGTTERVVRGDGTDGGRADHGALSGNGRYVFFSGNSFDDVATAGFFVFDRQTGDLERVEDGTMFREQQSHVAISDDGRWVAFVSTEFTSQHDIILFDRDSDTWEIANPRMGGEGPQSRQTDIDVSGNGRFVTFGSPDTNYVAGDAPDTNDVFVYDASSNSLERIPGGGGSVSQDPRPVISDDGRFVAFTSGLDIYGAANGRADVVVFDRQTDTGEVVSVHDDGSAADRSSGSYLEEGAISGDGRFVVFSTEWGFDPDDSGNVDFYIVDREGTTTPPPTGECSHDFTDVGSSNIFEDDICWLADQGITRGCNPPANTEFCPTDPVTRGQMAAFLVRALGYSDDGGGDLFDDDDGSVFEGDIDRLGTAGVTRGCNPPTNDRFCPDDLVTRGQMAAFLVRALGYSDDGGGDLFDDDDGSTFEADIDRLGTAGVTRGCNPPANNLFCPDDNVTRQQMAAFLRRALEG
jgi:Tol biopolymer transport system component